MTSTPVHGRPNGDKGAYVREMFARIAPRYDRANRVLTAGLDERWRRRAIALLAPPPGGRILDLCCGTGDLVFHLLRTDPSLDVTGVDFCAPMLDCARTRAPREARGKVEFVEGDAMSLPFADDSFDGATMGFSLRNVVDVDAVLREVLRVIEPGSRFVNLDVSKAPNKLWKRAFDLYFYGIVPLVGGIVGGSKQAYAYLPNSLTHHPNAIELRDRFAGAGFANAGYVPLMGGAIALHYGEQSVSDALLEPTRGGDADLHAMVETFFRETFTTDNPLITEAVKRMLAAGGKRLRPRITLLAVEACGGKAVEQLHLAAFMELIHVATLIHDDVVDNASTRRGVNATAVDYGNRVSVLAGDYLFAWIFKNVTAGYPHPVPHILSATLADICDGEVLQLRALGELALPLAEYIEVARKKTASLFAASAECGAIMGGGDPGEIAALRAYGDALGVAFQMKDDLLDVTADERSLGKPVGNDLTERKMTIPLIEALASGDEAFRTEVRSFYSGKENGGLHAIVEGIARQGGLAGTRKQIARFVDRAKASLEPIRNGTAKNELEKLAGALLVE